MRSSAALPERETGSQDELRLFKLRGARKWMSQDPTNASPESHHTSLLMWLVHGHARLEGKVDLLLRWQKPCPPKSTANGMSFWTKAIGLMAAIIKALIMISPWIIAGAVATWKWLLPRLPTFG